MKLRLVLLLALTLGLVLRSAPATLVDAALSSATDGRLRVLDARGSVWSGSGTFASLAADGRSAQPWLRGEWHTGLDALASGGLRWRLTENERTVVDLRLGAGGIDIGRMSFDAPLRALLDSVPHPVARAGWRGAIELASPGARCGWHGECTGTALLTWIGAGVDLVPERRFGDYELSIDADGRRGRFALRTIAGELRVDGAGGWEENGRPRFSGRVEGPAEIVGRLPNIMDGTVFPTADPAVAEIHLR